MIYTKLKLIENAQNQQNGNRHDLRADNSHDDHCTRLCVPDQHIRPSLQLDKEQDDQTARQFTARVSSFLGASARTKESPGKVLFSPTVLGKFLFSYFPSQVNAYSQITVRELAPTSPGKVHISPGVLGKPRDRIKSILKQLMF